MRKTQGKSTPRLSFGYVMKHLHKTKPTFISIFVFLNTNVYPGCDGHQLHHVIRFCGSMRFMVRPCGKASGNPPAATQAYFPLWLSLIQIGSDWIN